MKIFKTLDYFIFILKDDINFFNSIIEAYEGGAVCTTIMTKGKERIVRATVAPFFNGEFIRLCHYFRNNLKLFILIPKPLWYKDCDAKGNFKK